MIALAGMATLLLIAVLLSTDRRAINPRIVGAALALQIVIAGLILYLPAGGQALDTVVKGVQHVINFANAGIDFVFGADTRQNLGFTIALNVLPVIVFISSLVSVLYYFGIMQRVVAVLGGLLHRLLGTSPAESTSAISNIFVAHTDAPLVIKPYLARMSESELFAVMTGGCATIAGAVMAAYASMGIDLKYLITASFMAAPGGLLMAKIMLPETSVSDAGFSAQEEVDDERAVNVFEAIGNGAALGLRIALSVGALLLAFVAMIALLNGLLGLIGGWFGADDLTLQYMLGKVFAPIAFLIGVPWAEANVAGTLIGEKMVINEFYAYVNFVQIKESLSAQTQVIVTFALCGFANLASIAILLGGLGELVPSRRREIARLGLRAVIGGTLANLMNASLAGLFILLR